MNTHTLLELVADELKHTLQNVNAQDVDKLLAHILKAKRVFIAGKGRSGLQVQGFAMRLMHLGLAVHVVGEVTAPGISKGDILVIGSGSGRTASLVQHAERATRQGAALAVLTTSPESPIGRLADCIVTIPAPTPKVSGSDLSGSIQPMGTLFEQSLGILLDCVILQLMDRMGQTAEEMFGRHANLE